MQVHKAYFWGVKESPYLQVSVSGHFKTWKLWMSGHPWRNDVDQQLPTLLDVTSYVRLHTLLLCCYVLLGVIAQSLKPVKLSATYMQTDATTPNIVGPTMLEIIWKNRVIAVVDATFAVAEWKPERNSDLYHNGIRTLDLCDTGAALYQLSQQELTSQLGAGRWIGLL